MLLKKQQHLRLVVVVVLFLGVGCCKMCVIGVCRCFVFLVVFWYALFVCVFFLCLFVVVLVVARCYRLSLVVVVCCCLLWFVVVFGVVYCWLLLLVGFVSFVT